MKKSSNLGGGCLFLRQTFTKFSARLRSEEKYIILQRGYFLYFWGKLYPTYIHFPEPPTDYEVLFQQSPSFTSSFTRRNLRVGAI